METQALHFAELKLAISSNVGDSGAQFLVGGDCVRASPVCYNSIQTELLLYHVRCPIDLYIKTQWNVGYIWVASFPGMEEGEEESTAPGIHCLYIHLITTEFCGDHVYTYTGDVINSLH